MFALLNLSCRYCGARRPHILLYPNTLVCCCSSDGPTKRTLFGLKVHQATLTKVLLPAVQQYFTHSTRIPQSAFPQHSPCVPRLLYNLIDRFISIEPRLFSTNNQAHYTNNIPQHHANTKTSRSQGVTSQCPACAWLSAYVNHRNAGVSLLGPSWTWW